MSRPAVVTIAGARIEAGQAVMLDKDGTLVPFHEGRPKVGQRARVSFEGLIVGSDPDPRFMHFTPTGPGTGRDEIWRVPIDKTEVIG